VIRGAAVDGMLAVVVAASVISDWLEVLSGRLTRR
jgi:hypothetical protein